MLGTIINIPFNHIPKYIHKCNICLVHKASLAHFTTRVEVQSLEHDEYIRVLMPTNLKLCLYCSGFLYVFRRENIKFRDMMSICSVHFEAKQSKQVYYKYMGNIHFLNCIEYIVYKIDRWGKGAPE